MSIRNYVAGIGVGLASLLGAGEAKGDMQVSIQPESHEIIADGVTPYRFDLVFNASDTDLLPEQVTWTVGDIPSWANLDSIGWPSNQNPSPISSGDFFANELMIHNWLDDSVGTDGKLTNNFRETYDFVPAGREGIVSQMYFTFDKNSPLGDYDRFNLDYFSVSGLGSTPYTRTIGNGIEIIEDNNITITPEPSTGLAGALAAGAAASALPRRRKEYSSE